ncbi:MAG: ATP-binding protein [Atopobiaceae bacterium]
MGQEDNPNDLLGFVSSLGGGDGLRVEENLGEGFVRLRVSEAERRQAKHDIRSLESAVIELLRNARDAGARRIFVALWRDGSTRTVVVLDDGSGIPADMRDRVFDARVTSKLETMRMDRWGVHGRGMALFSIRENATSAEVLDSDVGCGTCIRVVTDADVLPERADQSTWPLAHLDHGTLRLGSGPHNVVRACCEFACEERGRLNVYVGSAAQVVSTIRERIPEDDPSLLGTDFRSSVLDRLYRPMGPRELSSQANQLGLAMSERTAQRIVSGEIEPLQDCCRALRGECSPGSGRHQQSPGASGPKLSREDAETLARGVATQSEAVLQKYYRRVVGTPKVSVRGDRITVTLRLQDTD